MMGGALSHAPLRIMHVAAPGRTGGLESVIVQLGAGLRARGHDVRVAAVLPPGTDRDHPFLEALAREGVPAHPVLVRGREYWAERRAVRALMQSHDVQVLHTHGYRPDVLHGSVAHALGRKHVTTLHGFVGGTRRGRFYEWLQVRMARHADRVVAVSVPIVERLASAGVTGNVELVRNAVAPCRDALSREEARRALGLPLEGFLVGWVGRVSPEKGPELFVEALARTDAAVHGVIVGDGPELAATQSLAVAHGIAERLHTVGLVPQASRYLAAFDALALTSRTEGTPMILLEAMWAGVPIVATAVGGVPQVLSPAQATLVPPRDAAAVAAALGAYWRDRPLRDRLAADARAYVAAAFGVEEWIGQHERLYRQTMMSADMPHTHKTSNLLLPVNEARGSVVQ
jgi:glycosyltransferase involved in cell wall biosynthesis